MTTATTTAELSAAKSGSFGRSASYLMVGGLAGQVLAAVTFGLAARELGRPVLGLLVALLSAGSVFQDLLDFGSSQWLSREVAASRLTAGGAQRVFRARAVWALCVACLVTALATDLGLPAQLGIATAGYVVCAVLNAGAHAQMRAAGRFRRAGLHLVAERVCWLVLAVAIVLQRPPADEAAAELVAAMGFAYLVSALLVPRVPAERRTPSLPRLTAMYRRSVSFGLLGLFSDLQQLDATAAAGIAGLGVAADVGVASKLTGPVALMANGLSQVAFRSAAVGGEVAKRGARSATRISRVLALAVVVGAALLPMVVVAVLGQQYAGARGAIFVYGVGAAITVINQPLAYILTADRREKAVARVVAVSVAVGLAVGVATVQDWGAVGMGLGYALTQTMILCGCVFLLRRRPAHRPG